jgi:multicomponent Na+:H+ antiporter subunit F
VDALNVIFVILAVAMVLAVARFIIGPTLPDRVIALDTIAMISLGTIAVSAIERESPDLLDVGVLVAFVTFLGTVAFALYIERQAP